MPPSLPTGTVSQTSAGTRTFPPDSNSDRERERVAAASPHRPPSQTQSLPTPDQPRGPPSPVIPRREHDVAVAREHDRVAELARENEALRAYIQEQATDKQAVIERYEHLLQQRNSLEASDAATDPSPSSAATDRPASTSAGLVDTLRTGLSTLRSRTARWLGVD